MHDHAPLPSAPARPSSTLAGAYAGALARLEPARAERLFGWRVRRKRWMYVLAASDRVLAAAAVVEGGWFAGAFAWAADLEKGTVLVEVSAAGLPGLHARVSDHSGPGAFARFRGRGLTVRIDRDVRGWMLDVESRRGAIGATLEVPRGSQPFTFVAAVPRGGLRATEKASGLAARGEVRLAGRTLPLDGGFGGVDVTAGVLARETRWLWAFGSGLAAGEPFGFNLCSGFGVPPDDPGENAAFRGSAPWRLPPVRIDPGRSEWRIASGDGALDLVFTPLADHRERRNLGVLRTRFTQVAGTFAGKLPGPDEGAVTVVNLPGVVEDHWAVW